RRHSPRILAPSWLARLTNSSRDDIVLTSRHGTLPSLSSLVPGSVRCQPCLRTPVNHVCGLYTNPPPRGGRGQLVQVTPVWAAGCSLPLEGVKLSIGSFTGLGRG